jgi:hypothetical protein
MPNRKNGADIVTGLHHSIYRTPVICETRLCDHYPLEGSFEKVIQSDLRRRECGRSNFALFTVSDSLSRFPLHEVSRSEQHVYKHVTVHKKEKQKVGPPDNKLGFIISFSRTLYLHTGTVVYCVVIFHVVGTQYPRANISSSIFYSCLSVCGTIS